jgi:hypothetical protein
VASTSNERVLLQRRSPTHIGVCRDPILLFSGAFGQNNFAQVQQRWASEGAIAHGSARWIPTRRPFDQCGGFENGDSSAANVINEQAAATSWKFLMYRQVMFAVRDGQLAQLQRLRLTWAGACTSGLPIRQSVADTVDVAVLCVRFDIMPEHRAAGLLANGQQVCNELEQRTRCHAETLSRIAFVLISLDSRQCTTAVRMDVHSHCV